MTQAYIDVIAPKYQLPVQLVAAIVQAESAGDRFAMRHEPGYRYLWNVSRAVPYTVSGLTAADRLPPPDFPAIVGSTRLTEWIGQQTSWGYMQLMGAVARELGFAQPFPGLCDPLIGLNYGCRHLAALRDRFLPGFGWAGVAAAYNAGAPRLHGGVFANQKYVDKVANFGGLKGL